MLQVIEENADRSSVYIAAPSGNAPVALVVRWGVEDRAALRGPRFTPRLQLETKFRDRAVFDLRNATLVDMQLGGARKIRYSALGFFGFAGQSAITAPLVINIGPARKASAIFS